MSSPEPAPAESTGRSIITFTADSSAEQRAQALAEISGISSVATDSVGDSADPARMDTDAIVFDTLGIAVTTTAAAATELQASADDPQSVIVAVEPEYVVHAITTAPLVAHTHLSDTGRYTWGLAATRVPASPATGVGIRVAILDTGFDQSHPDFAGRQVIAKSFVTGEAPQDGHGHGTHCIGTVAGPKSTQPPQRRYGVAPDAQIYAGKVLSNAGSGSDAQILAGIEWAISQNCAVVSMSLGADVRQSSPAYEAVGRRALDNGTLVIAAAGNNASRPGNPGFVGRPANSPSIMAVGAVASDMKVAPFSARSGSETGGEVDICAPGVDVFSSWPMPQRYNTISGTSMATPHVAGIAVLYAQLTGKRGRDLWSALTQNAEEIGLPALDVGTGLASAPSGV